MKLNLVGLFFEQDKQGHMLTCSALAHNFTAIASLGGIGTILACGIGIGGAMLWGASKECGDDNTMTEHVRDLIADVIGAATCLIWLA